MLTPERRKQMDAVLGGQTTSPAKPTGTLTPQRRAQMDAVLTGQQSTEKPIPTNTGDYLKGMAGNILPSAGRAVGDIANAVIHPIQTAKGLYGLGSGLVSKVIPGKQKSEENVDALTGYYKQRYGKDLKKTVYEDPFGVLMDASTVVGGAGAALKGVGALGKVNTLSKAGKALTTVSRATDPLELAARGVSGVAGKATGRVASKIPSAESIYFRGIGSPKKLEKVQGIARAAGYGDASEFMQKYGLAGRSADQAKDVAASLGKEYYQTAGKQNKFASLSDVMSNLDKQIKKIINSDYAASDEGQVVLAELQRRKQLMEARFGQTGRVPGDGQTQVPLGELAEFRKQALDPDIKFDVTRPAAKTKATKMVRDVIREEINKADPRLKELGMDELLMDKLIPILESYQTRGSARQLFNFTKLGGAGIGAITQGIPGAISGFVVEQLANNPRVLAALSQLRKTKMPGTKSAKLFGKGAYLFGKAARGLRTDQVSKLSEDQKRPLTYK